MCATVHGRRHGPGLDGRVGVHAPTIQAKVGDVIAWTNNDSIGHTATVDDDPACTTETLAAVKRAP